MHRSMKTCNMRSCNDIPCTATEITWNLRWCKDIPCTAAELTCNIRWNKHIPFTEAEKTCNYAILQTYTFHAQQKWKHATSVRVAICTKGKVYLYYCMSIISLCLISNAYTVQTVIPYFEAFWRINLKCLHRC